MGVRAGKGKGTERGRGSSPGCSKPGLPSPRCPAHLAESPRGLQSLSRGFQVNHAALTEGLRALQRQRALLFQKQGTMSVCAAATGRVRTTAPQLRRK